MFASVLKNLHLRYWLPKKCINVDWFSSFVRICPLLCVLPMWCCSQVGMDRLAYFLAFSRLARRTALFWGHATTSGITRFDARAPSRDYRSKGSLKEEDSRRGGSGDGMSSSSSSESNMDDVINEDVNEGGVDYFLSSELFEAPFGGQRRYSERLYLMRGLTTCFHTPTPPGAAALAVVAAATQELGLPPLAPLDPAAVDDGKGARLYLVLFAFLLFLAGYSVCLK